MKKWTAMLASLGMIGLMAGCASPGGSTVNTKKGAVAGGLIGAAAGAVIGHQSGRALEGAAIGGAVGTVGGAVAGSAKDEEKAKTENP